MTPQPTLTLTGTGNLQIHIPMRIRRMRGRKMIFAPEALDGDVPDGPADVQAAVVQALGRAFSWSDAIESGEVHSICVFRSKVATRFGLKWPPNSEQSGHSFRSESGRFLAAAETGGRHVPK